MRKRSKMATELSEEEESVQRKPVKRKRRPFPVTEENGREQAILHGRRGVTVYGCHRILLYSPEEIRLRLRHDLLSVCGADLFCSSFASGTVEVKGDVDGVIFLERDALFSSDDEKKGSGKA